MATSARLKPHGGHQERASRSVASPGFRDAAVPKAAAEPQPPSVNALIFRHFVIHAPLALPDLKPSVNTCF